MIVFKIKGDGASRSAPGRNGRFIGGMPGMDYDTRGHWSTGARRHVPFDYDFRLANVFRLAEIGWCPSSTNKCNDCLCMEVDV